MIKNSGKLFALICYTGKDSKIMLNQGKYKLKKSVMEKQLNILVLANIVLLMSLDGLMCGLNREFILHNGKDLHYLWMPSQIKKQGIETVAANSTIKLIASYYLLFNQFIPLTLVVLLEMGKLHFTQNIESDADMYYEDHFIKNARGCSVQNLSIHEELGHINYIFSDKTGTLTNNSLSFKALSIKDKIFYGDLSELKESELCKEYKLDGKFQKQFDNFWRCATLCHDIIIFKYNNIDHYSGKSQDEVVILEAGRETGLSTLVGRNSDQMMIKLNDKVETYTIIKVIEFDSDRKMMTVIVRNEETNKTYAFNKGADTSILKRVNDKSVIETAKTDANNISRKGYRVLLYSMKELAFKETYTEEDCEEDLTLLGMTGVEDALQDGVIQCL
jgi:magnesium-transporting ATPase (P-type)